MDRVVASVVALFTTNDPENPTPVAISIVQGIEREVSYHGANMRGAFHTGTVISVVFQNVSV